MLRFIIQYRNNNREWRGLKNILETILESMVSGLKMKINVIKMKILVRSRESNIRIRIKLNYRTSWWLQILGKQYQALTENAKRK